MTNQLPGRIGDTPIVRWITDDDWKDAEVFTYAARALTTDTKTNLGDLRVSRSIMTDLLTHCFDIAEDLGGMIADMTIDANLGRFHRPVD